MYESWSNEVSELACSDGDIPADDAAYTVDRAAFVNCPVNVLAKCLGLEFRKVDGAIFQDVSDSRDGRYSGTVGSEPVDRRRRVASHDTVYSATIHVRKLHSGRRFWYKTRPLHFVWRLSI